MPYMIDPGTAAGGEEYLAYNKRRWGGDGWTKALRQRGKAEGLNFTDWRWWPNTLKAHTLVKYAEGEGVPAGVAKAAIFKALYEEGENISEEEVLANLAKSKLGLFRHDAYDCMRSGELTSEVLQDLRKSHQVVKGGVPFFVVRSVPHDPTERPYVFSGAQDARTLLALFKQIADAKGVADAEAPKGASGC